jgi:uncharacterized phage-associated protein
MPYPASLIAYAFVKKGIEEGNPITQMKLQKLVYFAHGIHLAKYGKPLINEVFQAWKFGPVVPVIYQDYKLYGSEPIADTDRLFGFINHKYEEPELSKLDGKAKDAINITWEALKDVNANQLSNWTHNDNSPWHKFFVPDVTDIPIPNTEIEEYFKTTFNLNVN